MSEDFEDKSPEEVDDYQRALGMLDRSGRIRTEFDYFFRRLDEVRAMDEDEVPEDTSDAWVFKDKEGRYVDAFRTYSERFGEAAEAVAKLLAAERITHYTRASIEHDVSGMLITLNQISSNEKLTSEDFLLDSGDSQGTE